MLCSEIHHLSFASMGGDVNWNSPVVSLTWGPADFLGCVPLKCRRISKEQILSLFCYTTFVSGCSEPYSFFALMCLLVLAGNQTIVIYYSSASPSFGRQENSKYSLNCQNLRYTIFPWYVCVFYSPLQSSRVHFEGFLQLSEQWVEQKL